jgi:hypothetical protein
VAVLGEESSLQTQMDKIFKNMSFQKYSPRHKGAGRKLTTTRPATTKQQKERRQRLQKQKQKQQQQTTNNNSNNNNNNNNNKNNNNNNNNHNNNNNEDRIIIKHQKITSRTSSLHTWHREQQCGAAHSGR